MPEILALHHVNVIAVTLRRKLISVAGALGFRLVKLTVNYATVQQRLDLARPRPMLCEGGMRTDAQG
jgi:hypothetical protein